MDNMDYLIILFTDVFKDVAMGRHPMDSDGGQLVEMLEG
jgi:hypothetical protein